MTGSDYAKLKARTDAMDKPLLELCAVCGIHFPTALGQVRDVVDKYGLEIAMACMKRLSMAVRDYRMGAVEQFMEIVEAKAGG